jgi:recombination protein RecA
MPAQQLALKQIEVFAAARLLDVGGLAAAEWSVEALAGRFIEIAGSPASAALTAAASLVLQAQKRGTWTAWIGSGESTFFPPDFAASGIDLEALPVIRVPDATKAARVADTLLRSGAFALVAIDLGRNAELPIAVQTRLVGLAQKHHAVLLALTQKESRGSLVSLRGETTRKRAEHDCFIWELRGIKDKRRIPGWEHTEICCGPDGMC